jgi:hypothetical protein
MTEMTAAADTSVESLNMRLQTEGLLADGVISPARAGIDWKESSQY